MSLEPITLETVLRTNVAPYILHGDSDYRQDRCDNNRPKQLIPPRYSTLPGIVMVRLRLANSGRSATSVVFCKNSSWRQTGTRSRDSVMSHSMTSAPSLMARSYASIVCSGRTPHDPRWPITSGRVDGRFPAAAKVSNSTCITTDRSTVVITIAVVVDRALQRTCTTGFLFNSPNFNSPNAIPNPNPNPIIWIRRIEIRRTERTPHNRTQTSA